jgi:hypothetical protein
MYEELGSVKEPVELSPSEALSSAEELLRKQGYRIIYRTGVLVVGKREDPNRLVSRGPVHLAVFARSHPEGGLRIKLYKSHRGHKEAIVTLLEEGNVFGEPAPRSEGVYRDSAEAASACRVTVVSKTALEHHVRRDPGCAVALLIAYAQWVQRNERAMERLVPRDIRPRLAMLVRTPIGACRR